MGRGGGAMEVGIRNLNDVGFFFRESSSTLTSLL